MLHGVSLDLRRGERLAMVGPSGSGKSTIGRLIAGVYAPASGAATVGGVPLVDRPLEKLRSEVGLITQEHHVFVGSIADNVRLGKADATRNEIEAALTVVGALDWARGSPEGLNTRVGSGGHRLTRAQEQELALARLILADPHTLVLDDATSLLDPRAARAAERSLGSVLQGVRSWRLPTGCIRLLMLIGSPWSRTAGSPNSALTRTCCSRTAPMQRYGIPGAIKGDQQLLSPGGPRWASTCLGPSYAWAVARQV